MKIRDLLKPFFGDRAFLGGYFDMYLMASEAEDGCATISQRQLAERWNATRDEVRSFLGKAITAGLISVLDESQEARIYSVVGVLPRRTKTGYSPLFEEAWKTYPLRPNHSKKKAFKCWAVWIKRGRTEESLLEVVHRFRAAMDGEGRKPNHIMHMSTFLATDGDYLDMPWEAPRASNDPNGPRNPMGPTARELQADLTGGVVD